MMQRRDNGPSTTRWTGAARLIGVVREEPGITRARAAQRLGIGSGNATELLARLREACVLAETPAPSTGRGRPTTHLGPHPEGPLVLAAELRSRDWRLASVDIGGHAQIVAGESASGSASSETPETLLESMAQAIGKQRKRLSGRVRAVSISVAGTVSDQRLVQFTTRGWIDVDLSPLTASSRDVPLLIGNDATLAGLAEARTGAARGARTALHLLVAAGLGGALVVDGVPMTGAHGAGGEYGHLPFGDSTKSCPCGARGCWDLNIDGRALARHLGDQPPADPHAYAYEVLSHAEHDRRTQDAFDSIADALGAGIAGLVNLHDPDVVTLGGLASPLRGAAPTVFDQAYRRGLMAFRKGSAPEILTAVHGEDGPLNGAAAMAIDHITTEASLAQWSSRDR